MTSTSRPSRDADIGADVPEAPTKDDILPCGGAAPAFKFFDSPELITGHHIIEFMHKYGLKVRQIMSLFSMAGDYWYSILKDPGQMIERVQICYLYRMLVDNPHLVVEPEIDFRTWYNEIFPGAVERDGSRAKFSVTIGMNPPAYQRLIEKGVDPSPLTQTTFNTVFRLAKTMAGDDERKAMHVAWDLTNNLFLIECRARNLNPGRIPSTSWNPKTADARKAKRVRPTAEEIKAKKDEEAKKKREKALAIREAKKMEAAANRKRVAEVGKKIRAEIGAMITDKMDEDLRQMEEQIRGNLRAAYGDRIEGASSDEDRKGLKAELIESEKIAIGELRAEIRKQARTQIDVAVKNAIESEKSKIKMQADILKKITGGAGKQSAPK